MPVNPTYPGVYVQEVSSGARAISGVSTSVTAFLGRAARGPTDQAVRLLSFADFERTFGGLFEPSTLSYAVRDFYLNGGQGAFVVRVFRPTFTEVQRNVARNTAQGFVSSLAALQGDDRTEDQAETTVRTRAAAINSLAESDNDRGVKQAAARVVVPIFDDALRLARASLLKAIRTEADKQLGRADLDNAGKASVRKTLAAAEGSVDGSKELLRVAGDALKAGQPPAATAEVVDPVVAAGTDAANTTPEQVRARVATAINAVAAGDRPKLAPLSAAVAVQPNLGAIRERAHRVADAQPAGPPRQAAQAVAASGPTAEQDFAALMLTLESAVNRAGPVTEARLVLPAESGQDADRLTLVAANPGSWSGRLKVRVDHNVSDQLTLNGAKVPKEDLFNLIVTDGTTTERFANLSVNPDDRTRRADEVLKGSSLVRLVGAVHRARPNAPPLPPGVAPFSKEDTGVVAYNGPTPSDGEDPDELTLVGNRDQKTGLYALENVDLFNLLCIPPPSRDNEPDERPLPDGALNAALAYCEERRAFFIADSPKNWNESVQDLLTNPLVKIPAPLLGDTGKNGAVFFPRYRATDPLRGNQEATFVTCGALAGLFARTDAARGVWKAPAGIDATIRGASDLAVKLTDLQNGVLNPVAINCLRAFPGIGIVSWGSRTLRGKDLLAEVDNKYIPVRRLTLYIEESLFRGTKFAVFEPNDEPLWAQIRLAVGSFLQGLYRQGAFQGRTPAEAYFVKCDGTTTTPQDINLGVVNVLVGFAPVKPAEFVILTIQQILQKPAP